MSLYVCVIFDPQKFSFLCPMEHADTQSMRTNDKRYSGGSNKSDIREGSCDWSVLIAHSKNSTQWDTGKHIIAERNRLS